MKMVILIPNLQQKNQSQFTKFCDQFVKFYDQKISEKLSNLATEKWSQISTFAIEKAIDFSIAKELTSNQIRLSIRLPKIDYKILQPKKSICDYATNKISCKIGRKRLL